MAAARPVTGGMFGFEFPARGRPLGVNSALHGLANAAGKGKATRRRIIAPPQAPQLGRNRNRQGRRNTAIPREGSPFQLRRMEINTKGRTTGSAGLTRVHRRIMAN